MEYFGIQASKAEERYGEPRRVRITRLPRQEARSRDAKEMAQNGKFNNKAVGSHWDSTNQRLHGYVGRTVIGPSALFASLSS